MKNLKNLFFVIVLLSIYSCQEKEQAFTEFDDMEKGSFPRLTNPVNGIFDFDNFDNPDISFIEFEVEFYDENSGNMVESYSWDISYDDQTPVTIATKNKFDFVINENGLPSIFFRITSAEVFEALNLTINDFLSGKDFLMSATLKRTDGKIFTIENTDSDIIGSPTFQGFFQYKPEIINFPCFTNLQGTFNTYTQAVYSPPFGCQEVWEGQVRWEEEHNPTDLIRYYKIYSTESTTQSEFEDISMGAYYACYDPTSQNNLPNGDLKIKNECSILSFVGASQWGEIYSFTKVEADASTLKLKWVNNYGEAALVDLTRTDGKVWPEHLTCDGC
jgi:hypothetical protein